MEGSWFCYAAKDRHRQCAHPNDHRYGSRSDVVLVWVVTITTTTVTRTRSGLWNSKETLRFVRSYHTTRLMLREFRSSASSLGGKTNCPTRRKKEGVNFSSLEEGFCEHDVHVGLFWREISNITVFLLGSYYEMEKYFFVVQLTESSSLCRYVVVLSGAAARQHLLYVSRW